MPITARLIADMISVAGADRLLTMDLHQGQIQGFFNIPVDELTAIHLLSNYLQQKELENLVVVTDLGFAKRARTFAELVGRPLAIIEKRREGNDDRAELHERHRRGARQARHHRRRRDRHRRHAGGDDARPSSARVPARSTAAPPTACSRTRPSIASATRPSREVVITDTIPLPRAAGCDKIKVLSVAPLIGEAIARIHQGQSVGALFSSEMQRTQEMLLWGEDDEEPA